MARGSVVLMVALFMAVCLTTPSQAQPTTPPAGNPQGSGEAAQLRQEIQALRQQAEPLRTQLQQIEAQAKPLREQLRSIHAKIKADREKLQQLRGERKEQRQGNQPPGQGNQPPHQGNWQLHHSQHQPPASAQTGSGSN